MINLRTAYHRSLHLFAMIDLRFLVLDDVADVLGDEDGNLELIWRVSLEECNARSDRITFRDFRKILKGQPKVALPPPSSARIRLSVPSLLSQPAWKRLSAGAALLSAAVFEAAAFDGDSSRRESRSTAVRASATLSDIIDCANEEDDASSSELNYSADFSLPLYRKVVPTSEKLSEASRASSLLIKSPLYRHHLEMRLAVMEASKSFDQKLSDLQTRASRPRRASLIMKRGDLDKNYFAKVRRASEIESVDDAAKSDDQSTRVARKKTSSDIRGMM